MSFVPKRVVVSGAAGFIGFHVAKRLLRDGVEVLGIDNLNDYYDPRLKEARLGQLTEVGFRFVQVGIEDTARHREAIHDFEPNAYVHLAAQAGVRYSIEQPMAYGQSNLIGFLNVLETCRELKMAHLVYASSSSVYGLNTKMPFSVHDSVDHPISLYAATKKANELMAHAYAHLYGIPATGLRFFTVYGPWGRPDMALFLFTKAILEGRPIQLFNNGQMKRDFTYVDDIVEGVVSVLHKPAEPNVNWSGHSPDNATSPGPHRIYNIGNNRPVELMRLVEVLESSLGRSAQKEFLPMQAGDVLETFADIDDLREHFGFSPKTPIEEGIPKFVDWFRNYYGV